MKNPFVKASLCFRISSVIWQSEEKFEELLALFDAHPGATDEITLFSHWTHPPLPLETVRDNVPVLRRRLARAREAGYGAGINILSTMGHHNENLPHSLKGGFTRVTDPQGQVCLGCFCPNDPLLRDYLRELYTLYVSAGPDYLWIDDDVRLGGHAPVDKTCFCDRCVELFNTKHRFTHTRESLSAAFDSGTEAERLKLRRLWLAHNRRTIEDLLGFIERVVHEAAPGLPLGFMTGERQYEGYGFAGISAALAGPESAEVLWRPGGGFYTDYSLPGMTEKSHQIGRQCSLLPPQIRRIQSEIENFPYQIPRKSIRITTLEAALHIAAGCTGAAMNVLSEYGLLREEYAPMVQKIAQIRPFYDLLVKTVGRAPTAGLYTGWTTDSEAVRNLKGNWFGEGNGGGDTGGFAGELNDIGLPPAYGLEGRHITLLDAFAPRAMRNEDILKALSSGVYLNADALDCLNEMGYGELTGFTSGERFEADAVEELLSHPLNGRYAGVRRDARQSFYKCPAARLLPGPGAETLARTVDYADKEVAACGMGIFENRLGGRICAAGYYPWTFLKSAAKSAQLKRVMRWLSRDTLPAFVASWHRVNLWVRPLADGRIALIVCNMGYDEAQNLCISTISRAAQARIYNEKTQETLLPLTDGMLTLPRLTPFEICLVVV